MYYRFTKLSSIVLLIAMAGVIQAQGYLGAWRTGGPVARVAQNPILAPIPDGNTDPGSTTNESIVEGTPAPIVSDEEFTTGCETGGCDGCSEGCCDCGYCSENNYQFGGLACDGKLSRLVFGSDQCYGGPCDSPYLYHKGQFVVESWLDQGFTWNTANPGNQSNLPVTFNDRANEYEMNQLYLVMQRKLDHRKRWDWGARVDLLYGTDYVYTQAIGLETRNDGTNLWNGPGPRESFGGPGGAAMYGISMPQIYAEFLTPIAHGTTIKVGHFYSIMGHESVMAPENFFYSHSYTTQYAEPFTHTGILFDYRYRPNFAIKAGIVRGWDAWEDPSVLGESVQRVGFLGGVSWQSYDERTAMDFNIYAGNEQFAFFSNELQNRTNYSLVLKREISPRLTYVFQHDLGVQQGASFTFTTDPFAIKEIPAYWYTVVNYLYYKMNEKTSLGFRLEWFNDPKLSRVLQLPTSMGSTGGNYYEATVGLNWKPFNRCVVRPELRWDWSDVTPLGTQGSYNEFTDKNQFTMGVDVLYRF